MSVDDIYNPPSSAAIEFELQRPAPRTIPDFIYQGSYAKKELRRILILLFCSAVLYWYADSAIVKRLSFYILPLAYLYWIAGVLAITALWPAIRRLLKLGNYRWFIHGQPVAAKVLDITFQPTRRVQGNDVEWSYTALLAYPEPGTGKLIHAAAHSEKLSMTNVNVLRLHLKPGDYATALLLPGALNKPALYGFLNLNPQVQFLRAAAEQAGLKKHLGIAAFILGFLGLLMWDLYAFTFYQLVSLAHRDLTIWTLAGGTLLLLAVLRFARYTPSQPAPGKRWGKGLQAAQQVFLGFGFWILCCITVFCALLGINGICDKSPGRPVEVDVVEVTKKIHDLIFLEYQAEIKFPGRRETESVALQAENLNQGFSDRAELWVRSGYFGWEWIEKVKFL